jgi:penicillin V acylase-like amidase (Ntn superfamily)
LLHGAALSSSWFESFIGIEHGRWLKSGRATAGARQTLAAIAAWVAMIRLTRKEPNMRHQMRISIAVVLLLSFIEPAVSCTGFQLKDGKQLIVCFSFDHQIGAGHIYVNKRNVERQRYLLYAERPLAWVSKYGSVTFNLVGRDWPHDGMNEMGLVILSMGLDDTKFQTADSRVPLDENGWIQYQLDNSASIADVLEDMKKMRISSKCIVTATF